jgi:hypothetical protein
MSPGAKNGQAGQPLSGKHYGRAAMREVYEKAISVLREAGKDQISHQDFQKLVTLFNHLMDEGFFAEHPAMIAEYVKRLFGDDTMARDIQLIYETLEIVHRGDIALSEKTIRKVIPYH